MSNSCTSRLGARLALLAFLPVIACSSSSPGRAGGQDSAPGTGGKVGTGGSNPGGGAGSGGAAGGSGGAGLGGAPGASGGWSGATGGSAAGGGARGMGGATSEAIDGAAVVTGTGGVGPGSGGQSGAPSTTLRDGGAFATGGGSGSGASSGGSGGQASGDASPEAGGRDGASAYRPCQASPCKILPLGDSITHGLQSSDNAGYRSQLFKLIVAANQGVTFVGSQSSGPDQVSGKTFPKSHEGHDGYTVDSGYSTYGTPGISSLVPSPAFSTIPDIVLLHIGTNDITSTSSPGGTASRLDGLLGKLVDAAPQALIVVAQITPLGYASSDLTDYNAKIPGLVQARAAQGQHIISVDMSKMPTSDLASDKVHPADQGYAYMANIWYAAIKDDL